MKDKQMRFSSLDAENYGLDCAVVLNTVRYWLDKNKADNVNINNGRVWTKMSNEGFTRYYSFFSATQIKRILKKLVDKGVIIKDNFSKNPWDHTAYYSVLTDEYKSEPFDRTESSNRRDKIAPSTLDEIVPSSITTNKEDNKGTNKDSVELEKIPYAEIISMFNQITGQTLRTVKISAESKRHINARYNDGFTFDDFRHVITVKNAEWRGDAKSLPWIRPSTLFGPKFESYLQQKESFSSNGMSQNEADEIKEGGKW